MKVLIITTPNGLQKTQFPPIGALSVMNYVRKRLPHEFKFFNVDYFRPNYKEMLESILQFEPDVFAISAVISTSYVFTKRIATDVKKYLPKTLVVVGGNLCASAEILLNRANIDLCVLGEGEKIFHNVLLRAEKTRNPLDFKDITGLMLLGEKKELVNTGYDTPLEGNEVWDVDWDDLKADGTFDFYFPKLSGQLHYKRRYARENKNYAYNSENIDARQGFLTVAKGCVARCTFCHRWDKGIRHIPIDEVMRRFEQLYNKYNVRYFNMVAETFGSDKRWLSEFLQRIAPYRIIWGAGGVRTSAVSPELIAQMKDTGCSSLIYGNETGSKRMLELMEKKVSLEDNYNASKWTVEAHLGNIVQLVIGMPGESPETIQETIEYCKYSTSISAEQDPRQISINYAQALPGTPLYEYARIHGYFGNSDIDSEERYLIKISDREAADPQTFINFTEYPRAIVLSWNLLIRIAVRFHYYEKFGAAHYFGILERGIPDSVAYRNALDNIAKSGKPGFIFFVHLLLRMNTSELLAWYPRLFYKLRHFAPLLSILQATKQFGLQEGMLLVRDYIKHKIQKGKPEKIESISLRKIVDQQKKTMQVDDNPMMIPLRKGR